MKYKIQSDHQCRININIVENINIYAFKCINNYQVKYML
jgi:hypothetical protein